MPINNVVSTLPDQAYIVELERKLAALEQQMVRLQLDVTANSKGVSGT